MCLVSNETPRILVDLAADVVTARAAETVLAVEEVTPSCVSDEIFRLDEVVCLVSDKTPRIRLGLADIVAAVVGEVCRPTLMLVVPFVTGRKFEDPVACWTRRTDVVIND